MELLKNDHNIKQYFETYRNADMKDPKTRQLVLGYLVDKIYVYNDRILITCCLNDREYLTDYTDCLKRSGGVKDREGRVFDMDVVGCV